VTPAYPPTPCSDFTRSAVVDLGSNSVRMVVFEGRGRNPAAIFNEKAVLRLGRGLQDTGRLNDEAVEQTITVMDRYFAIARAMRAEPFEVLGTAAVRDAVNGPELIAALQARLPGVPIRILSGETEAELSARGVVCGIPGADGVLADIGGGSLELVRLVGGAAGAASTQRLGVIRLAERAGGDVARARAIAEADLASVSWLAEGAGRDLYAVGGAFRALARIHILQSGYPLNMIHHYTITREAARELTGLIINAPRRTLERLPGAPRRRIDDLPFAAVALRRVLRKAMPSRIVFSANGLREGWYMGLVAPDVAAQDPLIAAAAELGRALGRHPDLPQALIGWTAPLFASESPLERRLRVAACWMSDIGSHDHPEYRAEQAFLRVLRLPGVGMDHPARAWLGLVLALRYDAEPEAPFLALAHALLTPERVARAVVLGCALRLAFTLSAGTPELLGQTRLRLDDVLALRLDAGGGVFAGESITRRLERLAQALGLPAVPLQAA
jgi:exopolyphosphatase / guanosine-5'-triphosphate,3'-diphosphate pyrophosphatase